MADIDNLTIRITTEARAAIESLSRLAKSLEAVNAQLDRLDPNRIDGVTRATKAMDSSMSGAKNNAKELATNLNNVGQQAGNLSKVSTASKGMADALGNLRQQTSGAARSLSDVGKSAGASASNVFRSLSLNIANFIRYINSATTYFSLFGKVAKGAFKVVTTPIRIATKAMGKFSDSQNIATKTAKSLVKELTRVTKMLKLMVTRMALRAVIKEVGNGFKSLALHSEEFNASVSGLMNGAKQLGYSFAAMVSPLINALAPALVYVINLFIKLANVINQVFSALTGAGTWNKTKEFTDDWAKDIQAANKQAKELKKTVLGFDELNQLQEKYTSGGDTSNNIVDMFETVAIDKKWKDIADWLKQMWDIGDFYDLGKKLGEKLRDMLESIPWEEIRKTSNKLGKSLATLINGFIEVERLGYDIGYTIAQSINTVFEFLNGFVHNLHWDSIGKFIADTFNGFFENIDWKLIKDTVVTGAAGIAEAIQTFIEQFHWDNISQTIINGVDVIVSGVKAFVEGINWLELGQKMGEQIRKSIEGIDWKDIGEALGDIIQAGIDWVTGVIDTLPSVETLIQKLTDFMHGLFDRVDTGQLGENVAKILNYAYDVLSGFWDENGEEIKAKVAEFFKHFWDTIDKDDLEKVLKQILLAVTIAGIAYALGDFAKQLIALKMKILIQNLAGEAAVTSAAQGAGTTLGTIFRTAFVAAVAIGIGNALIELTQGAWSKLIIKGMEEAGYSQEEIDTKKKDLEYLEERYDGLAGKVTLLKDAFSGFDDVKLPSEEVKNLGIEVEDLRVPVIHIEDEFKELKIEVEKDTSGVNKAVGAIDFKPASEGAYKLDGDITHVFDNIDQNTQKFTRSINRDTKGAFDTVKLNSKVMTETVPQEVYNATVTMTGTVKELSASLDKETKTGFDNAETNSKVFTVEMPSEVTDAQKSMSDSLGTLSKNFTDNTATINKTVDDSMKEVNKSFDTVRDGMSKDKWTFSGVTDGLKKTFSDALDSVKGLWNRFADKMNEGGEIGNERFHIKLPRFAGGGFPENGLFLANSSELVGRFSNGRTAVANNEQIVDGIAAGVYNAVSSAMARSNSGSNGSYIANTIVVDGEVIARTVTKAQERQQMRYSPSMG